MYDKFNPNQYNYGSQPRTATPPPFNLSTQVAQIMRLTYLKMFGGLLITAFVSLFCVSSPAMMNLLFGNRIMMWVLFGAQFAIVLGFGAALRRMTSTLATGLFIAFAVLQGMSLTPIFLVYTGASLVKTFFICAGTFGAMSIYGFVTKQDLSKMGKILIMALFGLIIASLVNIFMKSSGFDFIISIFGVVIFVGLTAWDTQAIKQMAIQMPNQAGRVSTLGALNLYMDFINLFLYLLRFFGNSRD